jgi:ribosomal protein S12 methylthiotransferase accessory factor
MSALSLRSRYINSSWEPILYQLADEEWHGLEDLMRFYGPFGLVRKVSTYFGAGGTLPTYVAHGEYFDFDHVLRRLTGFTGVGSGVTRTIFGGGKGDSLFRVFASTLGELVERVWGSLYYLEKSKHSIYGSYLQLTAEGRRCLSPAELPLFAPQQYVDPDMLFDPFTEDSRLGWIEGRRLFSGESVWVPAQLVLLYYQIMHDEAVVGFSTTGGLATHISEREALYHGIVELFERDAVNVSWYSRLAPAAIEIDRPVRNPALRSLMSAAAGLAGSMTFYAHILDTPEIPVLTVVEIDEWLKRYSYYSGGGGDLDIDTVMLSAMVEFGQAERNMRLALIAPRWRFARALGHMFDIEEDAPLRKLNIFFKIVPYYGYKVNAAKMRWYTESGRSVPLSSLPTLEDQSLDARWERLSGILRRHAIDPIVFDLTPPQMTHARLMKAFIPELVPPFPASTPLLGHPRYYELPRALGRSDHRLEFDELNADPLPYP